MSTAIGRNYTKEAGFFFFLGVGKTFDYLCTRTVFPPDLALKFSDFSKTVHTFLLRYEKGMKKKKQFDFLQNCAYDSSESVHIYFTHIKVLNVQIVRLGSESLNQSDNLEENRARTKYDFFHFFIPTPSKHMRLISWFLISMDRHFASQPSCTPFHACLELNEGFQYAP